MFLRWKTRQSRLQWKGETYLTACLVTSVRTQRGPRQQHVAYLGTIASTNGQFSISDIERFWKQVDRCLGTLHLSVEQAARLQTAVERRIGPRPSAEVLRENERRWQAELEELARLLSFQGTRKR